MVFVLVESVERDEAGENLGFVKITVCLICSLCVCVCSVCGVPVIVCGQIDLNGMDVRTSSLLQ